MRAGSLCLVVAFVLLAGCAASRPEIPKDRYALAQQPEVYLIHQTAGRPFLVEKKGEQAGAIMFGGVVGQTATMISRTFRSARLQQGLDLQDPVPYLKDRIAESLRRELGLTNLRVEAGASDLPILPKEAAEPREDLPRTSASPPGGISPERRRAAAAQNAVPPAVAGTFKEKHPSGAVIEVVTQHWGMEDYRMKYYASARLIDVAQSTVLLSTRCSWVIFEQIDLKELPRPTGFDSFGRYNPNLLLEYDEAVEERLSANNGALLKASLRKAAEICADRIVTRLMAPRSGVKNEALEQSQEGK